MSREKANMKGCEYKNTILHENVKDTTYATKRDKPILSAGKETIQVEYEPCLLLRKPQVIRDILVKNFNYFCDRSTSPDSKDRLSSASLAFIKNPAWKVLKSTLTPLFTLRKLKIMVDLMLKSADNLDTNFESMRRIFVDSRNNLTYLLAGEGQMLDVKDIFGKLATDMIGSTVFGIEMNSLLDSNAEFRKMGKEIFNFTSNRSYEMLAMFFYPKIAHLADTYFFGKKSYFDWDDLIARALIFFTGGFETTSTAMSFALYEFVLHPEIQNKLRKEILDAMILLTNQTRKFSVGSLPYLDMVISEILRKYPVMPFIDRQTVKTYQMPNSNLLIEKGTRIFISLLGIHYDPQYFPDPEKFDPKRFSQGSRSNIPTYAYMPFGKGPHMCIGYVLVCSGAQLIVSGNVRYVCAFNLSPSACGDESSRGNDC
ncbi:PREDICTED: cytochrome P450 6l1-like [Dinoponera quadriceps]|uniref:Cytochrome P450 6l1-like n=1 Tax=Dinoponera quadriceps TaxID=609295 RepID=A0A6P3Y8G9_DINQU|nr:PREDICTED: cytochrome P450 6l1-like [Dinoponera quadriceps]